VPIFLQARSYEELSKRGSDSFLERKNNYGMQIFEKKWIKTII
jgi:hypothetical protein